MEIMNNLVKKLSLRFKLMSLLVAVALSCIVVVSTISYREFKTALGSQAKNQLLAVSKLMRSETEVFFHDSKVFSQRLATNRLVEGMILSYESAFYGAGLNPGEDQNVVTGLYKKIDKTYHDRSLTLLSDFKLGNFLIASLDSQIIMSAKKDEKGDYLGRHLLDGAYKGTKLEACFSKALSDTKSIINFSGYEYNKVTKKAAAYMCVKQFAEFDHLSEGIKVGEVMGIVIAELDIEHLSHIITQRVGMGETGQTYIVGADHLLRTDFFVNKSKFNTSSSLLNKLKVNSVPVDRALAGENGTVIAINPNNTEVLSSYAPINIFGKKWAFIAEVSVDEVFSSIDDMLIYISIVGLCGLAIILVLVYFLTSYLISPVVKANGTLGNVADFVLGNSAKMKENSKALSNSSNSIITAIQETVTTLNELSQMVQKNVENVEQSTIKSQNSESSALEGKKAVSDMSQAMSEINSSNEVMVDEMGTISDQVSEVVNVISEISTKTEVINDIVFQTKLLSFNASVEAARAGESGKGFAVVADEIGKLATDSGNAASEISLMLEDSVKTVQSIVENAKVKIDMVSQEGKEKVKLGEQKATDCGNILDTILSNVKEVNGQVQQISISSSEQASGINEVTHSMNKLDQMTNQTTEISDDALSASGELATESDRLSEVVKNLTQLVEGER